MLHHDIPQRMDLGRGQRQVRVSGPAAYPVSPFPAPVLKRGTKVTQPLQREQVGSQRNGHEIRGNQGGTVDRTEIGAEVDQNRTMERRFRAKRRLVAVQTIGPRGRELRLEPG